MFVVHGGDRRLATGDWRLAIDGPWGITVPHLRSPVSTLANTFTCDRRLKASDVGLHLANCQVAPGAAEGVEHLLVLKYGFAQVDHLRQRIMPETQTPAIRYFQGIVKKFVVGSCPEERMASMVDCQSRLTVVIYMAVGTLQQTIRLAWVCGKDK